MCCHSNVFNCGSVFSLSYWSMLLLYCVVYSKITQLEKQDNRNVFLQRTQFKSKILSVALLKVLLTSYGNMFDHGCASLVFLRRTMVVYPCDIHKVSRLLTGKKGQLRNRVPSIAMMTNFGFGPGLYLAPARQPAAAKFCVGRLNFKKDEPDWRVRILSVV